MQRGVVERNVTGGGASCVMPACPTRFSHTYPPHWHAMRCDCSHSAIFSQLFVVGPCCASFLCILRIIAISSFHDLSPGCRLSGTDLARIAKATVGYSASDLTALCKEAAMGPVRELGPRIASVQLNQIRPLALNDFAAALQVIKPSVSPASLKEFEDFTQEYGTM